MMTVFVAMIMSATAMLLALWPVCRLLPGERLRRPARSVMRSRRTHGAGLGIMLASIVASLESGISVDDAIIMSAHSVNPYRRDECIRVTDSGGRLDSGRLSAILSTCRADNETMRHAAQIACALVAARELSATLGCAMAHGVMAVRRAFLRMKLSDDLTRTAFAVPRATVRMLSALPAVTLLLGELLGARPVTFLFGSMQGMLCLALGTTSYSIGLWWMRLLLKQGGPS